MFHAREHHRARAFVTPTALSAGNFTQSIISLFLMSMLGDRERNGSPGQFPLLGGGKHYKVLSGIRPGESARARHSNAEPGNGFINEATGKAVIDEREKGWYSIFQNICSLHCRSACYALCHAALKILIVTVLCGSFMRWTISTGFQGCRHTHSIS
jgi:hypothetical protein